MPRKRRFWNTIPTLVVGGDDPTAVMKAWGLRAWGNDFGKERAYIGWQRVSLPEGWSISLEGHDFFLLDERDQVRGSITNVFRRKPSTGILGKALDKAPTKKIKRVPTLRLQKALTFHSSFNLGDQGPYSYWVEDPMGQRLFSVNDIEVADEDADVELPRLAKLVEDWTKENYPDYKSYLTYWDTFT